MSWINHYDLSIFILLDVVRLNNTIDKNILICYTLGTVKKGKILYENTLSDKRRKNF
jgi:hypothetical protein